MPMPQHGRELSWVCLAACTLDTLANASILFYVRATPYPAIRKSLTSAMDQITTDSGRTLPKPTISELPTFFRPGESVYEEGEVQEEDRRRNGREPRLSEKIDYSPTPGRLSSYGDGSEELGVLPPQPWGSPSGSAHASPRGTFVVGYVEHHPPPGAGEFLRDREPGSLQSSDRASPVPSSSRAFETPTSELDALDFETDEGLANAKR